MIARWLLSILEVCPEVVSIPGVDNVVADALSRIRIANVVLFNEMTSLVPEHLRYSVFWNAHAGSLGGHFGLNNTINGLRKSYFWPGMEADVTRWCKACQHCIEFKSKDNAKL